MKTVYTNFRIVDAEHDVEGTLVVEDGLIKTIIPAEQTAAESRALLFELAGASHFIDGTKLKDPASHELPVLLPSFIDLHAHFRDPGHPHKETLESATLAAVKGGYTTLVCMANTDPVTDTLTAAAALKARSDVLGLTDLYPAMSLTKGMEGRELSEIAELASLRHHAGGTQCRARNIEGVSTISAARCGPHECFPLNKCNRVRLPPASSPCSGPTLTPQVRSPHGLPAPSSAGVRPRNAPDHGAELFPCVLILSEDGKDIADDALFGKALRAAAQAGIPVSCHCDLDGENAATARVLKLAGETGARVHIAHVSTKEAAAMIAAAKREHPGQITAEATPHHFFLTQSRADELGRDTFGKVAPPLRSDADRKAVLEVLLEGSIDAIATDHAPHTQADKESGAPGFSGLETAFAVACTAIVQSGKGDLCHLSRLLSATPACILGLDDRGTLECGKRADLVIVNPEMRWMADKAALRSRGKNTPFDGMELSGLVLATILGGKIVYETTIKTLIETTIKA
ncbi:MAG: amidohydrolase family protein [Spirochaetaceae bacterium]|jgi:dihydroorotase|nr:amidohydrolase family protein [Spirochaetaceae bacterium]